MCFQCGEKDCERYEPKPPEWLEELAKDKEVEKYFKELVIKLEDAYDRLRKSNKKPNGRKRDNVR